jgi:hypothetical protein
VLRLPPGIPEPVYRADALPRTAKLNAELIRLPPFPQADRELLDQYGLAFEKVIRNADAIAAAVSEPDRKV